MICSYDKIGQLYKKSGCCRLAPTSKCSGGKSPQFDIYPARLFDLEVLAIKLFGIEREERR